MQGPFGGPQARGRGEGRFQPGGDPIAERAEARPRRPAPSPVPLPGPKRRAARHGGITFWTFAEKLIDEIEEGFGMASDAANARGEAAQNGRWGLCSGTFWWNLVVLPRRTARRRRL